MPPRFRWRGADIYVPLKVRLEPNIYYGVNLRIRPGVSVADANADLQPILQEFAKETPTRYPDQFRVHLRSIVELYARPMGPRLYLLLGAVTSLLLIGCANVSILLLVRGAHRQQELAVRSALGAARIRIVRQLLTEAVVIAAIGAVLGVLIAWKALALIVAWVYHRHRRRRPQRRPAQPDQAGLLRTVHAEDADVHADPGPRARASAVHPARHPR
jgi:hypothetical protein